MKIEVESVVGASKFLQDVIDAPAAVSIVTSHDIEVYGYRTLADIIRSTPGFNVTYDRNYSYVGVRGFQRPGDYNSRVLVLVDGHRLNDPIYNMAYLGNEFPLDLSVIDRVELIRGPSSSVYGTNAFFAAINVVTKKGHDLSGFQVSGEAGSLHTGGGAAAFGATLANGLDVVLSASRYGSHGQPGIYFEEFDLPGYNQGVAAHLDGETDYNLFGAVAVGGFSVQGAYGSRRKDVPTAAFGALFNDPRFMTNDAQGWADVRYTRALARSWKVIGRGYYDREAYDSDIPVDVSETDEPVYQVIADHAHTGWWGAEIGVEGTIARRHRVTAGAEFRDNFKLDQGTIVIADGTVLFDDNRSSHDSALFFEDQYTVNSKLLLNAGVRLDRYQGFGSTTNPRLALIYKPEEKTAIKLLWGTAFRAPNAYELYFSSDIFVANPLLEPEKIRTGEIVVERYFSDRYRIMANVYSSHVRGLINQVVNEDGTLIFRNLDSASTRGFEAEIEGNWLAVSSRLSYSHQRTRNLVTGKPLVNSARHLATGNLTAPLAGGHLLAGLDVHYVGPVETLNGTFTNSFIQPNVTLTTRDFRSGLSVSASVYNLFNQSYGYPAGDENRQNIIHQNGRTFRIGLKYLWRRPSTVNAATPD
jgi:iron complex outermembrane receptor protein